jgi:tetratricopeptide (TPR) repeat protein
MKRTPDLLCLLGSTYISRGDNDSGSRLYKEVFKSNHKNFRILYSLGFGMFRLEDYNTALFCCKRALELRQDGGLWKLLGRVQMSLGMHPQSVESLEMAAELGEADALLYQAEVYKEMKEMEKAVKSYERYIQIGKRNKTSIMKYLVEHYEETGDVEKSRKLRISLSTDSGESRNSCQPHK